MNTNIEKETVSTTKELVISAIFIALTLVATMFINIRLPIMGNGGLIHLGNVPLFLAAFIFGRKTGAIAGGVGMGLFDLISGWTAWAPFTFVIVGSMGWVSGVIAEKLHLKNEIKYLIAIFAACLIKIVGYYFTEVILYHNWIVPFGSIPGNIIQVLLAGIIVLPFAGRLSAVARSMSLI
ncbi:MAG: ECF transporter S component [Bacillota bacterium]|nr:ECF transporter S component [Bacillota bacterium]